MEYAELRRAILEGDVRAAVAGVTILLESGNEPAEILQQGMISAMNEVGELFERGEYYVPEMLIAARAMKAGLQVLRPRLVSAGVQPVAKVALGTVHGDIHDIGKNLVAMMMEGAGFEVLDLGVNVPPEKFVEAVRSGVKVIGLSGLLTTTIPAMPDVIKVLQDAGLRDQVKVMVGGAPVTQSYADRIGADGYAPDASQAVKRAKALLGI